MRIITNDHMTETVTPRITRHFKPGQRKGRDKSLAKVYFMPSIIKPMDGVVVMGDTGVIVCHPALLEQVQRVLESGDDIWTSPLF